VTTASRQPTSSRMWRLILARCTDDQHAEQLVSAECSTQWREISGHLLDVVAMLLADRTGAGIRLVERQIDLALAEKTGKSRTELKYRVQFFERFPTEEQMCHGVTHLGSWHEVVANNFGRVGPLEPPQRRDGSAEHNRDRIRDAYDQAKAP
jgi:hypothetical protein